MGGPRHVLIPVLDGQRRRGSEEVEVEALGENRFRVVCPPRFAYGLAVGDEIAIEDGAPLGFRTLARGGNLTVWFYASESGHEKRLQRAALARVGAIGAVVEGAPERMVILTVPVSAGWAAIAAVMNEIAHDCLGAVWEYANVYDPLDGRTPLRWWPAGAERQARAPDELSGRDAADYAKRLRVLRVDSSGWEIEYVEDPTGERWRMDYPQSALHGGGPARLRRIPG